GRETAGLAADDGEHQRQAVAGGAQHGMGRAADADPGRNAARRDGRLDQLVDERRAGCAAPGHRLTAQELYQQVELFLEQRLVVLDIIAEERKAVGGRGTADNELRAAI